MKRIRSIRSNRIRILLILVRFGSDQTFHSNNFFELKCKVNSRSSVRLRHKGETRNSVQDGILPQIWYSYGNTICLLIHVDLTAEKSQRNTQGNTQTNL